MRWHIGSDARHRSGIHQSSGRARGRTVRRLSPMTSYGFVGDLLLRNGVVDAAGLTRAMATQAEDKATLGRALNNLSLADESVVAFTIAAALHLEYLDG